MPKMAIIISLNGHTEELVEAARVCQQNEVPVILLLPNGASPPNKTQYHVCWYKSRVHISQIMKFVRAYYYKSSAESYSMHTQYELPAKNVYIEGVYWYDK